MITEPAQAEEIVAAGRADVVLLARQLLREPPLAAARRPRLGADHKWPVQYESEVGELRRQALAPRTRRSNSMASAGAQRLRQEVMRGRR